MTATNPSATVVALIQRALAASTTGPHASAGAEMIAREMFDREGSTAWIPELPVGAGFADAIWRELDFRVANGEHAGLEFEHAEQVVYVAGRIGTIAVFCSTSLQPSAGNEPASSVLAFRAAECETAVFAEPLAANWAFSEAELFARDAIRQAFALVTNIDGISAWDATRRLRAAFNHAAAKFGSDNDLSDPAVVERLEDEMTGICQDRIDADDFNLEDMARRLARVGLSEPQQFINEMRERAQLAREDADE